MPVIVPAASGVLWSLKVEIAFIADPYAAAPAWTDVSADVLSFECDRGRNYYLATMETGTATVLLQNPDGRYSPDNASGPHAGTVLPRRPACITLSAGGTTYPLWRGFVDTLTQSWPDDDNYTVLEVKAVDAFETVLSATMPERFVDIVAEDAPAYWYRPDPGNAQTGGIRPGNGQTVTTVSGSLVNAASAGDTKLRIAWNSGSFLYVGAALTVPDGSAIFYSNNFEAYLSITSPDTASTHPPIILFSESQTGAAPFYIGGGQALFLVHSSTSSSGYKLILGNVQAGAPTLTSTPASTVTEYGNLNLGAVYQIATVMTPAGVTEIYVNGAKWTTTIGAPLLSGRSLAFWGFQSGQTTGPVGLVMEVDEVQVYGNGALTGAKVATHYSLAGLGGTPIADFPSQSTGARINAVLDVIGWPTADRAVDAGATIMPASGNAVGRTALDLIIEAAQAELGEAFVDGSGRLVFHGRHHRDAAVPVATFGDQSGETNYTKALKVIIDQTRIINYVKVTQAGVDNPQTSIRGDATSMSVYKNRPPLELTLPIANTADADGMADTLLARYKDPHLRVEGLEIDLLSDASAARILNTVSREIGDLVTFNRRPIGGYATSITNRVEGLHFEYQAFPRSFAASLNLEPAGSVATY